MKEQISTLYITADDDSQTALQFCLEAGKMA